MTANTLLTRFVWFSLFAGIYGNTAYVAHFTDVVMGCDGFENKCLDCKDLQLSEAKTPEGLDACGLSGPLEIMQSIDSDHDVYIEIWKQLPCDKEMMWSTRVKLCESLKNTDAPWYCLVEAMNITGCPIQGGTYNIKDMVISLDFMKDILSHEFCGAYEVALQIVKGTDPISCHTCEVSIEEDN